MSKVKMAVYNQNNKLEDFGVYDSLKEALEDLINPKAGMP